MNKENIIFVLDVLFLIGECIHSYHLRVPPYGIILVTFIYVITGYCLGSPISMCFKHDTMDEIALLNGELKTPPGSWECSRKLLSGMFSNMAFLSLLFNSHIEDRRKKNLKRQQELEKDVNEKV